MKDDNPVKNMSPWGLESELSFWPAANWGRRCRSQKYFIALIALPLKARVTEAEKSS